MSSLTKYFSQAWNHLQFSPFRLQEEQTVAPWQNSHPNFMKQICKEHRGLTQNEEKLCSTPEKYRCLKTVHSNSPKITPRYSVKTHHNSSQTQRKHTSILTERKKAVSCIKLPQFEPRRAVKTPLQKKNPQKKLLIYSQVKLAIDKSKKYPRLANQSPSLFQINNLRDLLLERKKELIMSRVLKYK